MEAIVKPCTCTVGPAAKYQDEKYGNGQRVHTPRPKNGKGTSEPPRCTVCGRA